MKPDVAPFRLYFMFNREKESALWGQQKVQIKGRNFGQVLDISRETSHTWYITTLLS